MPWYAIHLLCSKFDVIPVRNVFIHNDMMSNDWDELILNVNIKRLDVIYKQIETKILGSNTVSP